MLKKVRPSVVFCRFPKTVLNVCRFTYSEREFDK